MNIQLALDRFTIAEAIEIASKVKDSVDWIEVGTSLIKEFGLASIKEIKGAFPEHIIVADVKTIDNAQYEFEMCFKAGADVATVMGVSPIVTIETCMNVARKMKKQVMIDLLNTTDEQKKELLQFKDAIFCFHVSKDEQEVNKQKQTGNFFNGENSSFSPEKIAIAGGISHESIKGLMGMNPYVAIIGSAITKAEDSAKAAADFRKIVLTEKENFHE